MPPEHSAAALHPENRHKLARAEAYAVVLVELAVCAARENPVAVVALVCLGELGNDVDELRRVFDFRLRNHDAEFFVGKFFHFYGLGFDRFFAPQFGMRAYLRRFGEKPRRHNRRHQDRQNFFHSLSCVRIGIFRQKKRRAASQKFRRCNALWLTYRVLPHTIEI